MQRALLQSSFAALLAVSFAIAQQPSGDSKDAALQALLKEVHALRLALEQSNQIGPRIQIVLARIQLQEERVRNATRQQQDARDNIADILTKKSELADRLKQFETMQEQTVDPNARKQLDLEMTEMKAAGERLNAREQQFHAKEADANSLVLTEQGRWNEANDMLKSIERSLTPPQP